jgi:hypothetical protein
MNQSCDTCAKRGPWEKQIPRAWPRSGLNAYWIAPCLHTPLPPFWGGGTVPWVMRGCGSECRHYLIREQPSKLPPEKPCKD